MATLKEGQWFMYPVDEAIPETVTIYEGEVEKRRAVGKLTKMQAMALTRWHGYEGVYYSYKDGNYQWRDVRVVGDVQAWFGDDDDGGSAA